MTGEPTTAEEFVAAARAQESAGDYLLAFDIASRGVEHFSRDEMLKYLAVRALARAGSPLQAQQLYRDYGLGDSEDIDVASLEARIIKDLSFARGVERRSATASARLYQRIFERTRNPYPGINAATMWLLAGEAETSETLARQVLAICDGAVPAEREAGYWHHAIVAEAALLTGDLGRVARALSAATEAAGGQDDAIATTYRQLAGICRAKGLDRSLLDVLERPRVVYYNGHMLRAPDLPGRLAPEAEVEVAARIGRLVRELDVRIGYGALGAGADILVAEALLEHGAALHVVLPCGADDFIALSVTQAGPGWVERFRRCLDAAATVTCASRDGFLGDAILFAYSARIAMGLARIRASALATEPVMLSVWDGVSSVTGFGTAAEADYWASRGLALEVVDCGPPPAAMTNPPKPRAEAAPRPEERMIVAALFGDVKGFSGLREQDLPAFNRHVLGTLGTVIRRHDGNVRLAKTWGDAVHVVFDDIVEAAHSALEMQAALSGLDYAALSLPAGIGMRLSLHVGPVYAGYDHIAEDQYFFGHALTRAARVEPITPVGEVYVTEEFAALIEMEQGETLNCNYVGIVPLAKGYGELRMYRLVELISTEA